MTDKETALEQILRQAIRFEEDAYDFYTGAVGMVKRPHIREALQDMAAEELKHKDRDTARIVSASKMDKIGDLKLAEYLVPRPLDVDATLQDVLIVAMHREKSSHEFYSTRAEIADEQAPKSLFEFLAQQELMHKNKVETLYDEVVYREF
jgi:rubrerythrin